MTESTQQLAIVMASAIIIIATVAGAVAYVKIQDHVSIGSLLDKGYSAMEARCAITGSIRACAFTSTRPEYEVD